MTGIERAPALLFREGWTETTLAESGAYLFSFLVQGNAVTRQASFWDEPQSVLEVRDDGTQCLFQLRAPSEATVREMRAFIAKTENGGLFGRGATTPR